MDFYPKFSSSGVHQSAVRILYDVNNFINSTQSAPGDVQALRGLLRERWFFPSCIGKKFVPQQPCTQYAEQQTAEILTDVDSFLTSRYTTREDGVALRRLINRKSLFNSFSGSGCTVYHSTKTKVLKPENSESSTTYQKLVENYDKAVNGLHNHQIKKLTSNLAHQLTISSAELDNIQRKRDKSAKVRSLLDTLTTPSELRTSPNETALRFKKALENEQPELARDMFHH